MGKFVWYLKQLLPLTYRTEYGDADGRYHFVVWTMWFGRSFAVEDHIIHDPSPELRAVMEAV